MTLVVNHRGVVQEKELGSFSGIDRYDPDDSWIEVDASSLPQGGPAGGASPEP